MMFCRDGAEKGTRVHDLENLVIGGRFDVCQNIT